MLDFLSLADIQEQYEQEGFNITAVGRPHVHSQGGQSEGVIDGRFSFSMSINEGNIHDDDFVAVEVCMFVYVYLCACVFMCVYVWAFACVCIWVCVCKRKG